jgi:WXG100 family type VII secretion target
MGNPGDLMQGDTESMQHAGQVAGRVAADLQTCKTTLETKMEDSRAQWFGTAGPACAAAVAKWGEGMRLLHQALSTLGDGVTVTSFNYDQMEADNTAAMNRVQGASAFGGALHVQ